MVVEGNIIRALESLQDKRAGTFQVKIIVLNKVHYLFVSERKRVLKCDPKAPGTASSFGSN
jgi:hypothetical protein